MKYKCIIFDCDGILVDSEEISSSVLVNMANEMGAKMNMQEADSNFTGKSLKSCITYIENIIGKALPSNFEEEFRKRSFELFRTELKPIKGVHELLNQINIPYCVASSGPVNKIRLNLTTTNLLDKFEGRIFSCYDIGSWKPNPDIFLHAAKEMGFEPKDCAVIEDSLSGVQAGLAGGFDVYAFTQDQNKSTFENLGAKAFFAMDDLLDLLA